jgi:myo-inositol-1(or 4)-monophosphatase
MADLNITEAGGLPSLDWVAHLAQSAGCLTLEYFRKSFGVNDKGNHLGLVTDADIASEAFIKEKISELYPDHVVLGEETGWTHSAQEGQTVWIIDPIDGTSNFSKGNAFYCVSIGCGTLAGGRFVPLRAAIVQPSTGDVYAAGQGLGAWCNGQRLALTADTLDPRRWSIATGFSSNKGESLAGVIRCAETMQNEILGMRINGAAALDLALTSRGIFDGFFESRLSPWDMAAGDLLVREAGGVVVNYDGEPFNALTDKNIVAGPQHVVEHLLRMLMRVKEEFKGSAWP